MRYFSTLTTCLAAAAATPVFAGPLLPRQSTSPSPTPTTPGACPPSGSARASPTMYTLSPSSPDAASPPGTLIDVEASNSTTREQAMVIGGIPASARTCSVIWIQGAPEERDFTVSGSGLVSVLQLEGFPAAGAPVSWNAVQPFVESTGAARNRHADFTAWDRPQYGAANHTLGGFDCAEEMRFHLSVDEAVSGPGSVRFQQDARNGFFVEYSC
ncbi:hypothetical protein F4810DRAFT_271638 [Camillea tinctor]|nr:hypothetical protein F4810DRAFT_271638 [Camillea tinctor]